MNILLLGSGGREHALAWKIAQSPKVEKLYIAPGNAGTKEVGENVNIAVCALCYTPARPIEDSLGAAVLRRLLRRHQRGNEIESLNIAVEEPCILRCHQRNGRMSV